MVKSFALAASKNSFNKLNWLELYVMTLNVKRVCLHFDKSVVCKTGHLKVLLAK